VTGWEVPPKKRPFRGSKRLIRIESQYYYDPFGRRLWKEVNNVRTYFVYADEGLVAEADSAGNVIKSYGYRPGSTWTTDPLFMKVGSEYYFYQNDHLGTPQKLTAVNGAVVWSAKYSSFGEAEVDLSSSVTNNLRFPGQYFDEETGLHYNYFRYYDPKLGMYLRPDPIGLIGGLNLYIYALNNPVKLLDALGLEPFDDYRYKNVVKCINKFGKEIAYCETLCGETEIAFCELKAKLYFRDCLQKFYESMDINEDGKVDYWDYMQWLFLRGIWNLRTPPGTPTPPGYGDEGPGSTDPRLLPHIPEA
jgi:RHS repeat-associated protein